MRTTITISEELAEDALSLTGKDRLSDAITDIISNQVRIKKQLEALEFLKKNKPMRTWKEVKAARKNRKWSV